MKRTASDSSLSKGLETEPKNMKLTWKSTSKIFGIVAVVISISRVCVLFLESLSTVRDERAHDLELLEICRSGAARGSLKMRTACLAAQADRASPIILKALLRAVSTAFEDFQYSVSSPAKFSVVLLFVASSFFLPLTTWAKTLFSSEIQDSAKHVVVLTNNSGTNSRGFRSRVAGALKMRKPSRKTSSSSFEEDTDESELVIDLEEDSKIKWA